jgi:hypothetical protein
MLPVTVEPVASAAGDAAIASLHQLLVEFLQGIEQLILVGAKPPVTFFAYPGKTSWPTPKGCKIMVLSHAHEDGSPLPFCRQTSSGMRETAIFTSAL